MDAAQAEQVFEPGRLACFRLDHLRAEAACRSAYPRPRRLKCRALAVGEATLPELAQQIVGAQALAAELLGKRGCQLLVG